MSHWVSYSELIGPRLEEDEPARPDCWDDRAWSGDLENVVACEELNTEVAA